MKIAATFQHSLKLLLGETYAISTLNKPVALEMMVKTQEEDFKIDLIYKILSIQAERYLPCFMSLSHFFLVTSQMISWLLFNGAHIKKDFFCLEIRVGRFLNSTTPQSPNPILSVSLFNISFFLLLLLSF